MQGDVDSSVSTPAWRAWSLAMMVVLTLGATACGQKGALVLPPAAAPAPAASAASR